ncbi:hypothetical protein BGZ92_004236 [Podila epicladia]|nr:hypothetical protein BGZ92_004236 [Podila epicladia]
MHVSSKPFSTNPASWTVASVLSHQKHPPNVIVKTASAASNTTTPWTVDDDKMLATFRRKKKDLAQIGIYIPHQPLETIEAKIAEYDARSSQKPTFQRWTPKEDKLLAEAVRKLGDRWAEISETYFMPPVPVPDADNTNFGSSPSGTHESTTTTSKQREVPDRARYAGRSSLEGGGGYKQGAWSVDEIELFRELVNPDTSLAGANDWEAISQAMGTRSAIQCHSQFKTVLHAGTKGKWTLAEISKLKEAVDVYGRDWQAVSKHVGTRAPGQVRQKWNQLSDKAVERLEKREASVK